MAISHFGVVVQVLPYKCSGPPLWGPKALYFFFGGVCVFVVFYFQGLHFHLWMKKHVVAWNLRLPLPPQRCRNGNLEEGPLGRRIRAHFFGNAVLLGLCWIYVEFMLGLCWIYAFGFMFICRI